VKQHSGARRHVGRRTLVRAAVAAGIAGLGLAISPVAAHASATLSASSGQVWGSTYGGAESAAEASAYSALLSVAQSHGYSTCINVTYSDTLVYVVPSGGGDVFSSTATGLCGNYVFQAGATLSATGSQTWGSTYGGAESAAEASAYSALLSVAQSHGYSTCINVTYSDTLVYVVPSGGGDVFSSTATGLCGNYVFQAGATLSATGSQTWGSTYGGAESAAEASAYSALLSVAQSHGYSTCINVTYSDTLVYVVPSGGGDVFVSTATGTCGTRSFQ
jgi:hypothetical protein